MKQSYLFCMGMKLGLTLWEEHGLNVSDEIVNDLLPHWHVCPSVLACVLGVKYSSTVKLSLKISLGSDGFIS
jgi:hypothetical protein